MGDWSVRIWTERNRAPVITLPYSRAYLTKGCWSPTRPGVFFTSQCVVAGRAGRERRRRFTSLPPPPHPLPTPRPASSPRGMDGVLSVWDLLVRQREPVYSHKVADVALSSLAVQGTPMSGGGRLVAVGDVAGTVSLLEVSANLAVPPAHEMV